MRPACRFSGWTLLLLAEVSFAQSMAGPRVQWWVEPRITTQVSALDRSGQSATEPQRLGILEVSPAVRVVANAARVSGAFEYALTGQKRAPDAVGVSSDDVWHTANGAGQIVLVDDALFVDASGTVTRQSVSAFGAQGSTTRDVNQTQTINGRLSPVWKGVLIGGLTYAARYTATGVLTESSARADSLGQAVDLQLARQASGPLGWSLDAMRQEVMYSGLTPDSQTSTLSGTVSYAWDPQWVGRMSAGRESTNLTTVDQQQHTILGAGLTWLPTPRSRFSAQVTDRAQGLTHEVAVEHTHGGTVFRFSDTRSVSAQSDVRTQAVVGNLYNLLDTALADLEPDPVARAALVESELRRRGLSGDLLLTREVLTSRATRQRQQQASVAFRRTRQALILSVNQTQTDRLSGDARSLGDDLDLAASVRALGWSVAASHQLTPRASLSLVFSAQKFRTDANLPAGGTESASLSVSHALGRQTTCALQWRRSRSLSAVDPFAENAVVGSLSHRF
jgi:uncharacterized protein (PEP-CTERM system associated)